MSETAKKDWGALKVLIGGILGMIVAMGIGRFAFTPILPLMQRDLGMTNTLAGWLAGLNYLGYLGGALLCSFAPQLLRYRLLTGGALLSSLATTLMMGFTVSVFWWGVMRLVGGAASAILFIVIAAEVAEALGRRGYGHWVGTLYGGVGFGIALSGLLVPWLDNVWGWDGAWIGMGITAILLAMAGVSIGRKRELVQPVQIALSEKSSGLRSIRLLATAYFFEGLGYVVTATFIVAIITVTPGLESFAPYSWVAVGFAAVPSTIIWPLLARRFGSKQALLAAYALQAAGILVSMHADSLGEVLFAAVSFGGTFLGIVAMTLAEGTVRMNGDGRRAAAILTASFGVGQMLGPVLAGMLADFQAGFALPLLLAGGSVVIGGLFIAFDYRFKSVCLSVRQD
jgi:MFS family permease